ncbi:MULTISPECIES: FAD synthetase family protein [Cytobacillus]|uniref:Riboflavin biosynthesis protein n=1 Tax=Cytobacillus stercorigallinarum TaxID=2762240 RepID=A0ABR8QP62_9BACI|nr:FAD synthetase family protein [Cytobacillus stercorigallinarum]MBD7937310.1 FAD synthetase family protein [Cytobacillus stercorigallinarum]
MEIYHLNEKTMNLHNVTSCVLALGFFDGVHKGHRRLLETAKRMATEKNLTFSVMTFFPHPSQCIPHAQTIDKYITPLPMKIEIFKRLGVEKLYIVQFNLQFSRITHTQFVERYIVGLACAHVVAGFDFTYGFKGKGNMKQLEQDSDGRFSVTTVEKYEHHHHKISSTAIRHLLQSGDVQTIPNYLAAYYSVRGKLCYHYRPDASEFVLCIQIDPTYFLPKTGLYHAALVMDSDELSGLLEVSNPSTSTLKFFVKKPQLALTYEEVTIHFLSYADDIAFEQAAT